MNKDWTVKITNAEAVAEILVSYQMNNTGNYMCMYQGRS